MTDEAVPAPRAKAGVDFNRKLATKAIGEAERVFMYRVETIARRMNWLPSAVSGVPVDRQGAPCPWYTFSMLRFLDTRRLTGLSVFEYGSGNSTQWWAKRASRVVSVENSQTWYERLKPELPAHVMYIFHELEEDGAYAREIRNHDPVDVIVIDGRDRVNCAMHCVEMLTDRTVVIWDNSNRTKYAEGYDTLTQAGLRRLDFYGHGPVNPGPWQTSVFYGPRNCLEI